MSETIAEIAARSGDHRYLALVLTTLSGVATGIGGIAILWSGEPSFTKLGHMLSFSAGVMMYISFVDLLFKSIESLGFTVANAAFFGGAFLFIFVIWLIPEPDLSVFFKGEDTSTTYAKDKNSKNDQKANPSQKKNNNNTKKSAKDSARQEGEKQQSKGKGIGGSEKDKRSLLQVGIITAFGISLHNFPEGMAVYLSCLARGPMVGLPLTLAIAAHNIPEGMAVAAPIYHACGDGWTAFKYAFLSGICEPVGALAVFLFLGNYLTQWFIEVLTAGVAGIMVMMTVKELIPTTLNYINADKATLSFMLGMVIISATILFLDQFI